MLCYAVSMRENGHLRLSKGVRTYTLQEPYPGIRLYKDDHFSALREPYIRAYGSIRLRLLNGYRFLHAGYTHAKEMEKQYTSLRRSIEYF
jgi:hypothetical protein